MQVTYLLGAGASCMKSLPVNSELTNALKDFCLEVYNNAPDGYGDLKEDFMNKLKNVWSLAGKELSIDTLAKSTDNDELFRDIKVLLWLYFSAVSGVVKCDARHKNLFLKYDDKNRGHFNLDIRVNFLSWNYDLQQEEALAELYESEIWRVGERFKTFPNCYYSSGTFQKPEPPYANYRIVHLNGVAGFYLDRRRTTHPIWTNKDPKRDAGDILEMYRSIYTNGGESKVDSTIKFAWESHHLQEETLGIAKEITRQTTHLVVIGYSFPDDNRDIDREIIAGMKKLSTIYLQVPEQHFVNIKEKVQEGILNLVTKPLNGKIEIRHQSDLTQFFKPPALKGHESSTQNVKG